MARGKSIVMEHEVRLIQKVALDCLTLKRIKLLRCLLEYYPHPAKTAEIAEKLRISPSTTQIWLEDLYILDIAEKTVVKSDGSKININSGAFLWSLKDKDAKLLKEIWG